MNTLFRPTLAILDLNVDRAEGVAKLKARPRGILAAIATLFGLGKTYTYKVDGDGYSETVRSPASELRTFVPWAHASAAIHAVRKPVHLLITAVGLVPASFSFLFTRDLAPIGYGMLAVAVLLILYYFLFAKKRTDVGILTDAATGEIMRVEARQDQIEDLQELYYLIQDMMMPEKGEPSPASRAAPSAGVAAAAPPPASATKVIACPRCDARMKVPANAVGRRVACSSCQHQFNVP